MEIVMSRFVFSYPFEIPPSDEMSLIQTADKMIDWYAATCTCDRRPEFKDYQELNKS